MLVAYYTREKLWADTPFFEACDHLFEAGPHLTPKRWFMWGAHSEFGLC